MQVCGNGHPDIVHNMASCPVCDLTKHLKSALHNCDEWMRLYHDLKDAINANHGTMASSAYKTRDVLDETSTGAMPKDGPTHVNQPGDDATMPATVPAKIPTRLDP